jgi:hypothetical protein
MELRAAKWHGNLRAGEARGPCWRRAESIFVRSEPWILQVQFLTSGGRYIPFARASRRERVVPARTAGERKVPFPPQRSRVKAEPLPSLYFPIADKLEVL